MSWEEAAAIVRRWADLSEAAARDRGVSAERLRQAEEALKDFPDQEALYVERNAMVGRVMRRLLKILEDKTRPVDIEKIPTIPVFRHEEPTR
jgi:hypothetical protein